MRRDTVPAMTTAGVERPIVTGIDGSESALGAARWAANVAAGQGLPLVLLHVIPRLDWHFAGGEAPVLHEGDADAVLAAAEEAVRSEHPDLAIRVEVHKGGHKGAHMDVHMDSVAAVLAAASESARLLALGSGASGHRALGGHVIRITHQAHCPVAVWRAPVARRTGKPLPVVVGVDESDESARALAEAFDIAQALHAPLTVAHMWEIGAAVGMGDLGGQGNMDWQLLDVLESRQQQQMDQMVQPLARKYPKAHVTKVFRDIGPAKGLTDLSGDAQLVVVGSHGRGRLAASLLGSVSQNLMHHAECPVLVVR